MKEVYLLLLCGLIAYSAAVPLLATESKTKIDGQYLLIFKPEITDEQTDLHVKNLSTFWNPDSNTLRHRYNIAGTFRGFSAKLDDATLNAELQSPDLAYIEVDQEAELFAYSSCSCEALNDNRLWALSRVSFRTTQALNYQYLVSPDSDGLNVDAYVVDTGINLNHNEFAGRLGTGKSFVSSEPTANDQNGHGSHVAGTIGGTNFGIARKVTLYAVKVLSASGSGTYDGVIAGINWVASQAQSRPTRRAVANMSLGGGFSTAINDAVDTAVNSGVTFVVAAGNDAANAEFYSPASADLAITVGATTQSDDRASFSNCGSPVDIMAPGYQTLSAYAGSNSAAAVLSGTSMASPVVAGVAALYLGENPSATPAQVRSNLIATGTTLNLSGDFSAGGVACPKLLVYIDCPTTPCS